MTIKQIWKKQLQVEVEIVKRCSAINVDFLTLDGVEDEVQLNVDNHILTKSGALFRRSARSSPATNTPASRRNTTSARRSRIWKNPAILYHAALSDNNNAR